MRERLTLRGACAIALSVLSLVGVAGPASAGATSTIFTVAGTGIQASGFDGGQASIADINHPRGLAQLPDGGFMVVEAFGNRVRRIFPDGTITTVAGTGAAGFSGDNGPAIAATLNLPHAVVAFADGSFLIDDALNYRIRLVSSTGTITTVAGTGIPGFSGDGGPASQARIGAPRAIAGTPDGGYLIADTDNQRIRKVSSAGIITTVAGSGAAGFSGDNGPATAAALNRPYAAVPTADGGYLVTDTFNQRIRRVSPAGVITTVAGTGASGFSGDNGPALSARVSTPHSAAPLPDGSFVIADTYNDRIRRVAEGVITTVAGNGSAGFSGEDVAPTSATLFNPKAVMSFAGGILIGDAENHRVRLVGSGPWPTPASGSGAVFVNGGDARTTSAQVSVSAPAHGGVSDVRLSNSPATSAGLLTLGVTAHAGGPFPWNLADPMTGGSSATGRRLVYVQWRSHGVWSAVKADSVVLAP